MPNLTPSQKIRLQLEKQMTQDAIARLEKYERENNSILPTFMGENGKIKRLGQGESRAAIATNLFYNIGEEMRSIPVRGGLPMVDNKPRLAPPIAALPEPPIEEIILSGYDFTIGLFVNIGDFGYGTINFNALGSSASPAFLEETTGLADEFETVGSINGLQASIDGRALETATEIWSSNGGGARIEFTLEDATILFVTVTVTVGGESLTEEIDLIGGISALSFDSIVPTPFPTTLDFSVAFSNPRRE